MSTLCQYGELLPRNFPHILEKIFLFLDYESFKICFKVCTTWRELIISELLKRKAKDTFSLEIEEDGRKLTLAAREGRITIIRGLLSTNMVDINMWSDIEREENWRDDEYHTTTPLFEAARNSHTDILSLLLDKGAKPNIPDEYGDTPLKAAAGKGNKEAVKLLIDSGADPNMFDDRKCTALHDAARMGYNNVIKMLLDIGADPNISNEEEETPLHDAAEKGHIDTVQLLLNTGADPNITNQYGETPLDMALDKEHNNVEDLLLENGARPNKKYYEQKLFMAIRKGNVKEVKRHLLRGVDINFGQSEPLREAVRAGHKNIVVLLLSNGANPNNHIDHGYVGMEESPLTMAIKEDKKDLVQILLDAGAKTNEEDQGDLEEWGCFDF